MPTYRGITVTLLSQYDALTIPEFPAPLVPRSRHSIDPVTSLPYSDYRNKHIIEMLIPIYPGSQFWINYNCPPPRATSVPASTTSVAPASSGTSSPEASVRSGSSEDGSDKLEKQTKFYFFRLLIDGVCLVRWGVSAAENWSGKMVHGIFSSPQVDLWGHRTLEKVGFFFKQNEELKRWEGGGLDVQVFRSFARKVAKVKCAQLEDIFGIDKNGAIGAVGIISTGHVKKCEPRRMYTYALVDSADCPYATFRYHYRGGRRHIGTPRVLPLCGSFESKPKARSSLGSTQSFDALPESGDEEGRVVERSQDEDHVSSSPPGLKSPLRRLSIPPNGKQLLYKPLPKTPEESPVKQPTSAKVSRLADTIDRLNCVMSPGKSVPPKLKSEQASHAAARGKAGVNLRNVMAEALMRRSENKCRPKAG